jgi:hypothetical protein
LRWGQSGHPYGKKVIADKIEFKELVNHTLLFELERFPLNISI